MATTRTTLLASAAEASPGNSFQPAHDQHHADVEQSGADTVLTENEVAKLTRLSGRTLQRLAEDGRGPRRIQLTERRIGYWRNDVLSWLASKTSPLKRAA